MKTYLPFTFSVVVILSGAVTTLATPLSQTTILNSGFESIGFDLGDGLRSADFWSNPSVLAGRAFNGRDGIFTGSNGFMRVITEGAAGGSTWQDITGSTDADTNYTFSATAYHTPNASSGLADYQVTMRLLEVGRGAVPGGATIDHAVPIEIDSHMVTLSVLGDTTPLSVTFSDDGSDVDVELRIQFDSGDPLPTGMFTRGGVDDVVLTTSAVPEPASAILLALGVFGLRCSPRRS